MDRKIIEKAQSALRDLYGLVPQVERKYADDYLRILEHTLNAYSANLDHMRQIEAVMHNASQYISHKVVEITQIEEG